MPGVHHSKEFDAFDDLSEVSISQHDGCRLATELEADSLELLSAHGADLAPHGCRAGEGDLVDAGMLDQMCSDRAIPGHNAHHALGDSGLNQEITQQEGAQRRLQGRFEYDAAAGQERGHEFGDPSEERHIPRGDRCDHADRLVAYDDIGAEGAGSGLFPGESSGNAQKGFDLHPRGRGLGQIGECDR